MPSNFQPNAILFLNSQFNLHFQPSNKQQGRGKGSTLIIIFKKLKYYQVHVEVRACGRGGGGAGGEGRWQEGPGCVSGSEQLLLYSSLSFLYHDIVSDFDKGAASPSDTKSSHGSCGGCTFPWLDWNNVTHYGCTDFDGDDHWSV